MGRVGGVAAVAALVAVGGCGTGREEAVERLREAGPIARVDVELDGGDVAIDATDGEGASGTITLRWSDIAPEVVHYVEDGVLHVLGRCDPYAGPCLLDVKLSVPASAAVSVQTREGNVRVAGVRGDVEVGTGAGDFEGHDIPGSLFVESDGGSIVADGLSGLFVDARTAEGDIDLRTRSRPARLVARTGNGDVSVVVPKGAYRIAADAPRGELDVGAAIQPDPAADAVLVVGTESGDVTIRATE